MRPLSQCTASCGGGFQKRTVHCVSSEDNKTEDQDQCLCDHEPRPPEFQKCNRQACRKSDGGWMSLLRGRRLFINKLSSTTEFVDSFSPLCWAGILMLKRPTSSPGSKLPDLVRFDSNSLRGYLIHFPFSKSVHTDVIPHRWESHLFIQRLLRDAPAFLRNPVRYWMALLIQLASLSQVRLPRNRLWGANLCARDSVRKCSQGRALKEWRKQDGKGR